MVRSPTDHDLRDVPPAMHHDGATVADFSPTSDEPDLDIWPRGTDRGVKEFSGDADDLVPIFNSVPEPHVRWVTPAQFGRQFQMPELLRKTSAADHDSGGATYGEQYIEVGHIYI